MSRSNSLKAEQGLIGARSGADPSGSAILISITGIARRVPETAILAYELFGIGDRHPAMPAREMSREEWERYAVWTADYQRRLSEDPSAKWGPPEKEAALLAEYRAGPVGYRQEPTDDDGP